MFVPVNYTDPSGRMPAQGGHAMPVSASDSGVATPASTGNSLSARAVSVSAATNSNSGVGSSNGSDGQSFTCFFQSIGDILGQIATAIGDAVKGIANAIGDLLNAARNSALWQKAAAVAEAFVDFATQVKTFSVQQTTNALEASGIADGWRQLTDRTSQVVDNINQWGAETFGGEENWQTFLLTVGFIAVAVGTIAAGILSGGTLLAPMALLLAGTAGGATLEIVKQVSSGEELDPMEIWQMAMRGGIAGGLTGLAGGGTAAFIGGFANAGVGYLFDDSADAEKYFLLDFGIGAVSEAAGGRIIKAKSFANNRFLNTFTGRATLSGLFEIGESEFAKVGRDLLFGEDFERPNNKDIVINFGIGAFGSLLGDFVNKKLIDTKKAQLFNKVGSYLDETENGFSFNHRKAITDVVNKGKRLDNLTSEIETLKEVLDIIETASFEIRNDIIYTIGSKSQESALLGRGIESAHKALKHAPSELGQFKADSVLAEDFSVAAGAFGSNLLGAGIDKVKEFVLPSIDNVSQLRNPYPTPVALPQ